MNYPTIALPAVVAGLVVLYFIRYWQGWGKTPGSYRWIFELEKPALKFPGRRFPMEKKDALPLAAITLIYAAVAFWGLGDRQAPESFYHFDAGTSSVTVDLGEDASISSVMYYTGLHSGWYSLSFSGDGETWVKEKAMEQKYSELFKWRYAELNSVNEKARYVKISADDLPLELGEVALYGTDGSLLSSSGFKFSGGAEALFDEQRLVPEKPDYLNSMYFDEIYHGRTALEFIKDVYPYEVSHPPLGKIFISIGIRLFGMTPFGWRFMGTLFGVLMLPIFYIFLKNLFGKTPVAACGTLLFAFDFMHFVQTRIATIDTYGVIFILLMYFFMYRFVTTDSEAPFRRAALPLILCGLSFGVGAASKWTAVYAGAGLALILFVHLFFRGRAFIRGGRGREFARFVVKTGLLSILMFILVPCFIYYSSYYYYAKAAGYSLYSKDTLKIVLDNQKFMFTYHEGVNEPHPYSSRWYQWIVDARPILYFSDDAGGYRSAFAAFTNPLVCWGGLPAIVSMAVLVFRRHDGKALFILIGYLSQFVPWLFITRTLFYYHYFPSVIFLVAALCHVLDYLYEKEEKLAVYGFTSAALLLFVMFYPVLTGVSLPRWIAYDFLKWFPSWPF